jgi:hypothetical protein
LAGSVSAADAAPPLQRRSMGRHRNRFSIAETTSNS